MKIRQVVGNSMAPTLLHGDIVIFGKKTVKVNTIVIANIRGHEVVKRVIKLKNTQVWLQGDNSMGSTDSREYGYVDGSKVQGSLLMILPLLRKQLKST